MWDTTLTIQRYSCSCGDNVVDLYEDCDGGACCTSDCKFASSSVVCRNATGVCDATDYCNGASASCPADTFLGTNVVCRPSVGACDPAETCTGTLANCPFDAKASNTTQCRASVKPCDKPEYCDGVSNACPTDQLYAAGTSCDDSNTCTASSNCTVAGDCSGVDVYCVGVCGDGIKALNEQCDDANLNNGDCCSSTCTFEAAGTVCRAAAGVCDAPETCTGTSGSCPSDAKFPNTTVCRAPNVTDPCDPPEYCTGLNNTCPTDFTRPNGTVCNNGNICANVSYCNTGKCQGVDVYCVGVCGDGIKATQEQCDDGNLLNGDCCSSACKFEASTTVCRNSTGICDPQETCTGSTGSCPADVMQPNTYVCRGTGSNTCDVPEYCTGSTGACPSDARLPNSTPCNNTNPCASTNGTCSAGECTGVDIYCVGICGDGIKASSEECDDGNLNNGDCCSSTCKIESSTTVCRASNGICDVAEYCTGVSPTCPTDSKVASGTVCRASKDATCDPAETCNGVNNTCPADNQLANGVACDDKNPCTDVSTCNSGYCLGVDVRCNGTCGDGIKASSEECDDANLKDGDCCSHLCKIEPSGTVCRSSQGNCDLQETCNGINSTCPPDVKSTAVCRDAVSSCDAPEYCDGAANDCPYDSLKPEGTTCPDTSCTINSTCTIDGSCNGIDIYCVGICGDGIKALSEQCDDGNLDNGDCCSSTCKFEPSTTVCRASKGICDIVETCTGSTGSCPADTRHDTSYVCRAAASTCDVPDYCSASGSYDCGANNYQSAGFVCDDNNACTNSSTCDGEGSCTGVDIYCVGVCGDGIVAANEQCDGGPCCTSQCTFANTLTVCRASAGVCDQAETCTGASSQCPADVFVPSTTVCRGSVSPCDPQEYCSGSGADCPVDSRLPDGSTCDDGSSCTATSTCTANVCSGVDIYCSGVCGDGIVASGEDCDDAISTDCCRNCTWLPSNTQCRPADANDPCYPAQFCSGTSGICPPTAKRCPVCAGNCSGHGECVADGVCVCDAGWTYNDCSEPTCDIYSSCDNCTANSGCGWCCGENRCVKGGVSGPAAGTCASGSVYQYGSCGCNVTCQSGSTCVCGSCDCLPQTGGVDCSEKYTCEGYLIPGNETAHVDDVCGVCNGNGSTCLGCDGVSSHFYKKYDACGVCGGDGSSCYSVCNYDSCGTCTMADRCVWCGEEKKCIQKTDTKTTCTNKKTTCSQTSLLGQIGTTGAAIGGGVIAAIVIAVIIGVAVSVYGGKKTYQLIQEARSRKEAPITNNPLYEGVDHSVVNPLYEDEMATFQLH